MNDYTLRQRTTLPTWRTARAIPGVLAALLFSLLAGQAAPALAGSNPVGTLVIPSVSVVAPIVSIPMAQPTWDLTRLGDDVGYLEGTGAGIDQPGNVVLAGHLTDLTGGDPSVFYNLASVEPGDEINVYANDGVRRYVVTWTGVVDQRDMTPALPTADDRLTLFTCYAPTYTGGAYPQRFVVVALPAG